MARNHQPFLFCELRCPQAAFAKLLRAGLFVIILCSLLGVAESAEGNGRGYYLIFDGRIAWCTLAHPTIVRELVSGANAIVRCPYMYGGGHSSLYRGGFDCSGAVSHVLIQGRLLKKPLTSSEFQSYGEPGPGRYVTLFVKPGRHVFMSICGLRFDTNGGGIGEGPRWRPVSRSWEGFAVRHPPGL